MKSVNDILIYNPAKVGSSTIYNSLSKINVSSIQIHFLTGHFLDIEGINGFQEIYQNEEKAVFLKKWEKNIAD